MVLGIFWPKSWKILENPGGTKNRQLAFRKQISQSRINQVRSYDSPNYWVQTKVDNDRTSVRKKAEGNTFKFKFGGWGYIGSACCRLLQFQLHMVAFAVLTLAHLHRVQIKQHQIMKLTIINQHINTNTKEKYNSHWPRCKYCSWPSSTLMV